jgi:gamma-glutamyltranspeptidase/glutathione hydrolase
VTKKQEALHEYHEVLVQYNGPNLASKEHKENEYIKYPALASTLKRIATKGRDEFSQGRDS